jgi:antitoxin component YwqK of YwqJK toxin-antitoxin module
MKSNYAFGKVSGVYLFYWPNGNLYIKGQYLDGLRHGTWQFFSDDGNLKSEIIYKNGVAENEDEVIAKDKEFFKMVEENINSGKYKDPTMDDVMPRARDYY